MSEISRIQSYEVWEQECYNEIVKVILTSRGKINIALSGGSTPIPIYKRVGAFLLSLPVFKTENIRFFLVDERNVPLESSRSNSAMILKTIGQKFVVPFNPMTETPNEYFDQILQATDRKGAFDLIVLGCGNDGHTASLFPNTTLLQDNSSAFLSNELSTGEIRFSMTYSLILNAEKRVVFVNDNPEKIEYFTPLSMNKQSAPIHKVLAAPCTKVILHETL
jgi:6-phosphogluconolactonase